MKNRLLGIANLKRRVNYFIQKNALNIEKDSIKLNRTFFLIIVKGHGGSNSNVQLPGTISKQSRINSISISGICLTFN